MLNLGRTWQTQQQPYLQIARTGEEIAKLVERDRHHAIRRVEGLKGRTIKGLNKIHGSEQAEPRKSFSKHDEAGAHLFDTVTVVNVNINVQNARVVSATARSMTIGDDQDGQSCVCVT